MQQDAPTYESQEDQADSVQRPKKKGAGGGHLLDSGWMQALVPLAAIAATAIAPRKAGPAAHIGLGAYNAAQGARQGQLADERHENRYDQRRMQDVMQRKTERDEGRSYDKGLRLQDISRGKEEKAARRADLVKAIRGQAGVPGADMIGEPKQTSTTPPAGGGAPEAQSAVNATRFEQTRVPPKPTTGLSTEAADRILAMFDVDEGAAMREWDEETDAKKEQTPSELGMWISNHPNEPVENFWKAREATQRREPQPSNAQLVYSPDGEPLVFDPRARSVSRLNVPTGTPSPTPSGQVVSPENVRAEEVIATALANGEPIAIRQVSSMKGEARGRIFARTKEKNPKFDLSSVDRKIKMLDSVEVGKDRQQIQSFNTFLAHAGDAADALDAAGLTGSPLINKPISWIRANAAGDPALQRYLASLEPVRKEFEGFLLGGRALYAEDRKSADKILSDYASPAQAMAALQQLGHTAYLRYGQINHSYKRVMGTDIEDGLSPEALEGAKRIGLQVDTGNQAQTGQAGAVTATGPNGEKLKLENGAWVPIR